MNYKLPNLLLGSLLLTAAVWGSFWIESPQPLRFTHSAFAQQLPASTPKTGTPTTSETAPPALLGSQLLMQAAEKVAAGFPALSANLSLRGKLFGQSVTGTGIYLQSGARAGQLYLFQFKASVGSQHGKLVQLAQNFRKDGESIWIHRQFGKKSQLQRIHLKRLVNQVKQVAPYNNQRYLDQLYRSAFHPGSLGQLLTQLQFHYQFQQPAQVVSGKAGSYYLLQGVKTNQPPAAVPKELRQLPQQVQIFLRKGDFIPVLVRFYAKVGEEKQEPILTLQLSSISVGDPKITQTLEQFQNRASRHDTTEDLTDQYYAKVLSAEVIKRVSQQLQSAGKQLLR